MANLKLDLVNKINNRKYYDELELIRLAQEPNMNYAEKLELMDELLENIALVNLQVGLINEVYFKEPAPAPQNAPAPEAAQAAPAAPAAKVHQGQSHGE
jgi:hypothetical protein